MATTDQQKPRPGRPRGSKSKHTKEREQAIKAAAAIISTAIPTAKPIDAHTLLMSVYMDEAQPIELRIDAAKAAIRFEKPALAAVDMKSQVKRSILQLTDQELMAIIHAGTDGGDEPERPN